MNFAFTGQSVQSRLLRERLVELEIEIERFKKENAALSKLREENEKNQDALRFNVCLSRYSLLPPEAFRESRFCPAGKNVWSSNR